MPKKQNTASKKARALQRTAGGKHTTHLRATQVCGKQLDPFGVFPETCVRVPKHPAPCTDEPGFEQAAYDKQVAAEQAASEARWNALTPEERADEERRQFEAEHDDGRTASDDYEDARAYKWED
ncbi:hypothetical protein ACFYNF_34130 [Streptomyces sp. NPDC006641]|uniref:hypothetical protein n=1 Tax=unclassified Streptomyces TaxID=2593676 RepID=UPI00369FFD81